MHSYNLEENECFALYLVLCINILTCLQSDRIPPQIHLTLIKPMKVDNITFVFTVLQEYFIFAYGKANYRGVKLMMCVLYFSHRSEEVVHQMHIALEQFCQTVKCLNSWRLTAHRLAPTALQADKCSERSGGRFI